MGDFGISQPAPRFEDTRLLTGRGRYVDDVDFPGQLHAYVVRSPYAHADIVSIDVADAAAAPGVHTVLTGKDYEADGWGSIPHVGPPVTARDGGDPFFPPFAPIPADRVRFLGEAVAVVIADSAAIAKDAADLVMVEYADLPVAATTATALDADTPLVWPEHAVNESFVHHVGDKDATDAAFEKAAHVISERFVLTRVLANAMENRGCIAEFDPRDERYTLWAPVQHPWIVRRALANRVIGTDETQIRVLTEDVGGSFGIKANLYPEYLMCLWASKRLGRAVKWVSERSEGLISDYHGRDNVSDAALALDAEGNFIGMRVKTLVNLGAYLSPIGSGPATNNLGGLAGVYKTPAGHVEVIGVFTNEHPTAPYRGAGRPEASYTIERLIDLAAEELGQDPVELRRKNLIPPDAMPFKTALTFTYDSGHFEKNMDDALSLADRAGFEARRAEAADRGKLRGLGIGNCIERAAPPGMETAEIRFDPSGTITLFSGTTQQGQGHWTTYAQVLCDQLNLDPTKIRLVQGDTDKIAFGFGAGGSRCSALGSAAILAAGEKIIDKGKHIAAHVLEAAVEDIAFDDGTFAVAGTDRSVGWDKIIQTAFAPPQLPEGIEPGLYESATFKATTPSYPNGCHVCEVEIDPETGRVEIANYVVVDDFGTVLNPLLLKGQVHGGVAQGVGQVLMEEMVYDPESGQVLTGSFMDYCMPRGDDLSSIEVDSNPVPTATNPLGVKGAGEAGNVGALPAVMNAVIDALKPHGIRHMDMPATPKRVWQTIQAATAK